MHEHSIQANLFCFIFEHKLPFFKGYELNE